MFMIYLNIIKLLSRKIKLIMMMMYIKNKIKLILFNWSVRISFTSTEDLRS
jgi:predicted Zn-dependent protease